MNWADWSLRSNGLLWRVALPADAPAIAFIRERTAEKLGMQDDPDLFDSPVLICIVAEDEAGTIVDGFYVELEAHIKKLGLDRRALKSGPDLVPVLSGFLRSRKIRMVRMTVLKRWRGVMDAALAGMGFIRRSDAVDDWIRRP